MQLKNKNIFITGSSRGIGLAIAHKFAQAGANIVLNSRGPISEELLVEFSDYAHKDGHVTLKLGSERTIKKIRATSKTELKTIFVMVKSKSAKTVKLGRML